MTTKSCGSGLMSRIQLNLPFVPVLLSCELCNVLAHNAPLCRYRDDHDRILEESNSPKSLKPGESWLTCASIEETDEHQLGISSVAMAAR